MSAQRFFRPFPITRTAGTADASPAPARTPFAGLLAALLFGLLILTMPTPASAQSETPGAAESAAPAVIERERIEQLLKTLKDDNERAAFVAKLETMLAATAKSEPDNGAVIAGALSDIITGIGDFLRDSIAQLSDTVIALTDVRSLLPALSAIAADPSELLDIGYWLLGIAAVVGAGLFGARLVARLARSWIDRLDGWAGEGHYLRSVAAALPLFALRGLGALAFMLVSQAILSTFALGTHIVLAGRIFVLAVALHLGARALAGTLLAARGPVCRGLDIGEETAAYLQIWANRLIATGIYGVFGLQAAYALGLPVSTYLFLQKLVFAVLWAMIVAFVLQNRRNLADAIRERTRASSSRALWGFLAATWHLVALGYVTAGLVVLMAGREQGFQKLAEIALWMVAIGVVWRLGWMAVDRVGERAFAVSHELTTRFPSLEMRANRHLPVLLGAARVLISVGAVGALFQVWGLGIAEYLASSQGRALIRMLTTIVVVVASGVFAAELSALLIERRLRTLEENGKLGGRARTLLPLVRNAAMIMIFVLGGLIVLSEIGIDITPLLAGASIVGLAIGFGAQSLVKDVISGLFLLLEDTLNVGDTVEVGGKTGTVESLSIRALRLRDLNGNLHVIPFGSVEAITNMTKEYAFAVVDVGIAYREDADEVMKLLAELGEGLAEESSTVKDSLLAPFEVFGVQDLGDSSVVIRTRVKTKAGMQWAVRREILRRVKRRFDAEGVEMPFPHRTLYFGEMKDGSAPAAQVTLKTVGPSDEAGPKKETADAGAGYYETANPEMADAAVAREEAAKAERKEAAPDKKS